MPEYKIWKSAKARCRNPKDASYPKYGARGITFSAQWDNFEAFISDTGRRPSAKHSLERIDNDGPYSSDNCKWATDGEQAINKRMTIRAVIDGVSKPAVTWGRELGIPYATWKARMLKGMTSEQALTMPLYRHHKPKVSVSIMGNIQTDRSLGMSLRQLSEKHGVSKSHVRRLIVGKRGDT